MDEKYFSLKTNLQRQWLQEFAETMEEMIRVNYDVLTEDSIIQEVEKSCSAELTKDNKEYP